jgi:hypothetical protein
MTDANQPRSRRERAAEQGFSTAQETLLRSDSRLAIATVFVLTLALALGAFLLSFESLQELARASNITLAWLWPLIIDGFIITATIASYVLRGRTSVSWYAWASLVLFAGASIAGNAVHALLSADVIRVPVWAAALVNAAPAIALLIASHLLIIMLSTPRRLNIPAPSHIEPAPIAPAVPVIDAPLAETAPTVKAEPSLPTSEVAPAAAPAQPVAVAVPAKVNTTEAPEPKTDDELREWVARREASGKPVTERAVAGFLGRGTTLTDAQARLAQIGFSAPV